MDAQWDRNIDHHRLLSADFAGCPESGPISCACDGVIAFNRSIAEKPAAPNPNFSRLRLAKLGHHQHLAGSHLNRYAQEVASGRITDGTAMGAKSAR